MLLLAALGVPCATQAEETDGAFEPAAESLLRKDLFSGDSLFKETLTESPINAIIGC